MPVISNKITSDSVVYTDHWHSYNALDVTGFSHYRINHSSNFADGSNNINGIENFWNQEKECFENTMVLTEMPFYCLLKNVSFDLIMAALSNS